MPSFRMIGDPRAHRTGRAVFFRKRIRLRQHGLFLRKRGFSLRRPALRGGMLRALPGRPTSPWPPSAIADSCSSFLHRQRFRLGAGFLPLPGRARAGRRPAWWPSARAAEASNILAAAREARTRDMKVIALTGTRGSRLGALADIDTRDSVGPVLGPCPGAAYHRAPPPRPAGRADALSGSLLRGGSYVPHGSEKLHRAFGSPDMPAACLLAVSSALVSSHCPFSDHVSTPMTSRKSPDRAHRVPRGVASGGSS
ncbi:MAG: hypothetical protein MZU95_08685 [Desulfomicrobium escambiense]|nr:hypothetical protein [Desulfomicrobium escambiense]